MCCACATRQIPTPTRSSGKGLEAWLGQLARHTREALSAFVAFAPSSAARRRRGQFVLQILFLAISCTTLNVIFQHVHPCVQFCLFGRWQGWLGCAWTRYQEAHAHTRPRPTRAGCAAFSNFNSRSATVTHLLLLLCRQPVLRIKPWRRVPDASQPLHGAAWLGGRELILRKTSAHPCAGAITPSLSASRRASNSASCHSGRRRAVSAERKRHTGCTAHRRSGPGGHAIDSAGAR